MSTATLNIKYHAGQDKIFFQSKARRRTVAKGRRWGFTRGAGQFVIESMLDNIGPVMWGDTVAVNIVNYVERYFIPVLKQLPKDLWDWKKQEKKLYVNDQIVDFRSADNPENWEGFGYKIIILNEAGIILKNQYLWNNAVRPMLMDFPDSIAIIGGTPKGKNLFHELWSKEKGQVEDENQWESFQFSTFTNPFLTKKEIDELIEDLPSSVVRQEIYAEFTDEGMHIFIPSELVDMAMGRQIHVSQFHHAAKILGVDVARFGDDFSSTIRRQGLAATNLNKFSGLDTMQMSSVVAREIDEWNPDAVMVEEVGIGAAVVDRLRQLGFSDVVIAINPGIPEPTGSKYYNLRAAMWGKMKDWLQEGGCIPPDKKLKMDLSSVEFGFDNRERIQLEKKENMKKRGAESPDLADALALTFAMPVQPRNGIAGMRRHREVVGPDYDPYHRNEQRQETVAPDYDPYGRVR